MYTIRDYGLMLADRVRMQAYALALQRSVHAGSVVLDLGTGTGIMALLACKFGARRVYAIEPGEAIHLARELAVANHCAERIEFIQDLSTRVSLPEPADVAVFDLRDVLPWFRQGIGAIADARRRLLAPGAVLIPRRDTVWAALVQAPEPYERQVRMFQSNGFGLDLNAAHRTVCNEWVKVRLKSEHLLMEPQLWATLDYGKVEDPNVCGEIRESMLRAGTAHGWLLWFESELAEGTGFSNAPGAPEVIYGGALFPFPEPLELTKEDVVRGVLRAHLVGNDYEWQWDTDASDAHGRCKAGFRQATMLSLPLASGRFRKCDRDYVSKLNQQGVIDLFILSSMDGRNSLGRISQLLRERFPAEFPSEREALTRISGISLRYGQ